MPLNYWKQDADDGSNTDGAVEPILNSEPIEEAYLNRTVQNLRNRSEVVRGDYDSLEAIERSDRALVIMSPADTKIGVYDDSGYKFSCSNTGIVDTWNRSLIIVPLISPAILAAAVPIIAKFYYDDASSGEFEVEADSSRKVADGAHNILIRWFKGTQSLGNTPLITIEGTATPLSPDPTEGPVIITVELSKDDDTQISGIVAEINLHAGASSIVTAAVVSGGTNTVTTDMLPKRLYQGDNGSVGGVDDEAIVIPSATLSSFFLGSAKRIADGDTLVVNFLTAKLRRMSDADTDVVVGNLQLVSEDSRNTADNLGIVPICKRFGSTLYFSNGKAIAVDTIDYIVNSKQQTDDIRTELADQTGTPYGDYMVGAEAKTVDVLTISAGTVNAQLKDIAKLGEQDGTSGDTLVGAEVKTHTTRSLAKGSVNSQLDAMIGFYDNHITNATGADKHSIKNILEFEPLVVDASGNADYTTIQGALDVIAAGTGGIILVNSGVYNEVLTFPTNMAASLHLLAVGVVVIATTAPNPPLIFRGLGLEGAITIEGFKIQGGDPSFPKFVNFSGDDFASSAWITFKHCILGRTAATLSPFVETDADVNIRFEDCHLDGTGTEQSAGIASGPFINVLVAPVSEPRIEILNCYIESWAEIVHYEDHAIGDLGSLRFENNRIHECGYTDAADGDPSTALLYASNVLDTLKSCHVHNNTWYENASSPSENCGGFVRLGGGGNGSITNNVLQQPYDYIPATGQSEYMITAYNVNIVGNSLSVGLGGGIYGSRSEISNNRIMNFQGGAVGLSAILTLGESTIANNTIDCDTGTAPVCIAVIYADGGGCVSGNVITNAPAEIGIQLDSAGTVAIGNVIKFDAAGTGVKTVAAAHYCTISGNYITDANIGVDVESDFNTITGNVCYGPGTGVGGAYGINSASGATDGAITGNVIRNFEYGVYGNGGKYAMTGNILLGNGTNYGGTTTNWGAGPLPAWPGSGYDIDCFNITA